MTLAHVRMMDTMLMVGLGCFGIIIPEKIYDELRMAVTHALGGHDQEAHLDPNVQLPPQANAKAEVLRRFIAKAWQFPQELPRL